VGSTATIRAANHQVLGLFGSDVALYPPSGLNADDSFFAETDADAPGRVYLGVMPQAHTQAFATVLCCTALLQAPRALRLEGQASDAYCSGAYHNSLRELGARSQSRATTSRACSASEIGRTELPAACVGTALSN
jgi:hypothetical protein